MEQMLRYSRFRAFVLITLLFIFPLSVQGKIYAVFVGVSEYESANNLTYCHRDAAEMYELLKEYTLSGRMVLLTNQRAKHDNIVYYAKKLFQQALPEDVVIFFFSGHGNKSVFSTYDKMLYFSTLQKIFKECKANRKMIFADACFAGTLRQEGNQTTVSSGSQNAGKNVMIFMSSRSSQTSQEYSDLQNGVFTYFLLAALRGGADANKDRYITARELFNFVYPKVKERSNENQIPVMWGKFDKDMVILKLKDN